jgi:ActR/RegA family two-component response regulator
MNLAKRILFVGEEQPLWDEFRQRFHEENGEWQAEFATNSRDGLARLEQTAFTAVVADVRLLDSGGLDLLDEVLRRQPQMLRVVLSDLADTESTMKCVGKGHHHLIKPCDVATVIHALREALTMESWLPSTAVQGLIAKMRCIPSPPTLYLKVVSEMQSSSASVESIGAVIAQDPAISAKVLQLANSAVLGLQLQVIPRRRRLLISGWRQPRHWCCGLTPSRLLRICAFRDSPAIISGATR